MTNADELAAALSALAAAFDTLGVTWAIGGSLASAFHGEPRATNDVDVIAQLDAASARQLPGLLGEGFYADVDMAVEAATQHKCFNVIDTTSFIKIDIFVPGPGALGVGQLDRRRVAEVLGGPGPLPVLGPEDTVLQKLRWYRLTGETSERQWRDVISVLRISPELDDGYLDEVAALGHLDELLAAARADAARD